jgi:4-hydroxy-3-polyprenylbenzoate decarboxylase
VRLLQVLRALPDVELHLVMSAPGKKTLVAETDYTVKDVEALATSSTTTATSGSPLASGSFRTAGMAVVPCSIKTLSGARQLYGDTLIARAGDVALKERRRWSWSRARPPLHAGHLRQMLALAELGAVILPPMPAFYLRPQSIAEIVDHTVARVLDHLASSRRSYRSGRGPSARRDPLPELSSIVGRSAPLRIRKTFSRRHFDRQGSWHGRCLPSGKPKLSLGKDGLAVNLPCNSRGRFACVSAVLSVFLAFAPPLVAQGARRPASIPGSVTSNDGATLPGVVVTATSPTSRASARRSPTSPGPTPSAASRPATYKVSFTLTGFATLEHSVAVPLGGVAVAGRHAGRRLSGGDDSRW